MKLFKKLSFAALTVAALGCGGASASVVEHVQAVMDSGATFDGHITFADHYTSILGVDGYLSGTGYGNDHMTWNWNTYWGGTQFAFAPASDIHGVPVAGVLTDALVDGDANTDNYMHYLVLTWHAPADILTFDIGPEILINYAGVDTADRIVSVTVGDGAVVDPGTPSNVPEPGSIVLLGLGLAGVAAARRKG